MNFRKLLDKIGRQDEHVLKIEGCGCMVLIGWAIFTAGILMGLRIAHDMNL